MRSQCQDWSKPRLQPVQMDGGRGLWVSNPVSVVWVLVEHPKRYRSKTADIPGPSKGCPMDYPTLPIGFQTWHPLEGPGILYVCCQFCPSNLDSQRCREECLQRPTLRMGSATDVSFRSPKGEPWDSLMTRHYPPQWRFW